MGELFSGIKAGDFVVVEGAWCDLMRVTRVEGETVYFTTGDYTIISKVRLAHPDEIECNQKIYD